MKHPTRHDATSAASRAFAATRGHDGLTTQVVSSDANGGAGGRGADLVVLCKEWHCDTADAKPHMTVIGIANNQRPNAAVSPTGMRARRNGSASVKISRRRKASGLSAINSALKPSSGLVK